MAIKKDKLENPEFTAKLVELLQALDENEVEKILEAKKKADFERQYREEQEALESAYIAEARSGHKSFEEKQILRQKYKEMGLGSGMLLAEFQAKKEAEANAQPVHWREQIKSASQETLRQRFEADLKGARSKDDVSLILAKYRAYGLEDTTLPEQLLANRSA